MPTPRVNASAGPRSAMRAGPVGSCVRSTSARATTSKCSAARTRASAVSSSASLPEQQRVAVRGVNLLKRHTKSGVQGNIQGGIVDFDGPISYSNVMLVCNRCDKRTRIAHGVDELGRRVIVCKKCGEHYDRAQV